MRRVYIYSLIIIVLIAGAVTAGNNGMTIEDLYELHSVSSAVVSPDGELIAYTVNIPRKPFVDENGSDYKELYLINSDSVSTMYLSRKVKFSSVAFSPDGSFITYLAKRDDDEKKSLYKLSLSGGESQKLLEFETSIASYVFSPDGQTIAFIAADTLSSKRKDYQEQGFTQQVFEEDYTFSSIYLFKPELDSLPEKLSVTGHPTHLEWSPDGKYLSATLSPTPLVDDSFTSRKVTIINPSNSEIVQQFESVGKIGYMAWCPDSKKLAVIKGVDRNDPSAGRLCLADLETDQYTEIINQYDGHIYYVDWLDEETILYMASSHLGTVFGKVNSDGSSHIELLRDDQTVYSRMNLSDNKKVLSIVGSSWNHPRELYKYEFSKTPLRLTNNNRWLDSIALAKQEIVKFQARDGLEIEGVLIHPLSEKAGQKYPLIMAVHGGPESNHTNGWMTGYSYPGQIAAANGFAVFYTNYRGSTGRGVAFSKMGQADYAGGEFNDLVDAVEYLISTGLVDENKVGITGRSYGGYASAWGATGLSKHFAASVMGVGVSNLISKFGTTDIPQEMLDVHALKTPWDNWQWYLERSPIYHAKGSTTPILIVTNTGDTRVHPSQSMELYRFMKYLSDAPVRMVLYKNEKHGSSKAATKYDYTLRLMRWMDHYLKGEGGDPPPYEIEYPMMDDEK